MKIWIPKIRLLPALIGVAALVALAKGGSLWLEIDPADEARAQSEQETVSSAESQVASEGAGDGQQTTAADQIGGQVAALPDQSKAVEDSSSDQEALAESEDVLPLDPRSVPPQAVEPISPTPDFQMAELPTDPFALTDQEIDVLQTLAQRREELDQRARSIEEREIMLSAAEVRIDEKVAELEDLKESIEGLLAQYDLKADEQILSLVKIYGSMKPKDAARIFNELEMPVLIEVMDQMKERSSAAILAEMEPRRAKAVTLELAQRDSLPLARE
ncbi:MAG: hypothetical protein AAF530_05210 [Pseudomonadota bacterium]